MLSRNQPAHYRVEFTSCGIYALFEALHWHCVACDGHVCPLQFELIKHPSSQTSLPTVFKQNSHKHLVFEKKIKIHTTETPALKA